MADSERKGPKAVIVVGTPSSGSSPDEFNETMSRIERANRYPFNSEFLLARVSCQGSSIAHNQNNVVKAARDLSAQLAKDGIRPVDAILFIENDESFRNAEEVVARLWNHNKDIVGATYAFKFHDRIRAMGVELPIRDETGKEIVEAQNIDWMSLYHREPLTKVLALPIGALMIRMNVFDAMDAQQVKTTDETGQEQVSDRLPPFYHDVHYGLRVVRTTDYVFCCRANALGFDVWLDAPLSLEIEHWGKYPYAFPHPAKINRQIATLQMLADSLEKSSENPNADPEERAAHKAMSDDLFQVAADMVRRRGAFAYDPERAERQEAPEPVA